MNVLLVLASGKSSRFGGYPKAFCEIDGSYVVQRTVDLGARYFDKTYLVINRDIFSQYKDKIQGCATYQIGTGQGDSHSFLRAARLIKEDCNPDQITLCWGDTFYINDLLFRCASQTCVNHDSVGVSLASLDSEPYAWYEVEGDIIKSSHFRSLDGRIDEGIHDQSVFVFKTNQICRQLELYMHELGIKDEEDYVNKEESREMKLLDSFSYFYIKKLLPMKYAIVKPGMSYSFNTKEELEEIIDKISHVNRMNKP